MLDVREPNSHEQAPSKTTIFPKFNDYLGMPIQKITRIFLTFGQGIVPNDSATFSNRATYLAKV